jgi:hypothetical protein
MTQFCPVCSAEYPAQDSHCTNCREPSPLWEAREQQRLLNEPPMGYEAAWTGVPQA